MPVPFPVVYSHRSESAATLDRLRICSEGLNNVWRALKPYCGHRGSAFVRPDASIASPAVKNAPAQNFLPPRCMESGSYSETSLSIEGKGFGQANHQSAHWTHPFKEELRLTVNFVLRTNQFTLATANVRSNSMKAIVIHKSLTFEPGARTAWRAGATGPS